MKTNKIEDKVLAIIKNYAGEGNDDFVNKTVALLTSEVENAIGKDENEFDGEGGEYNREKAVRNQLRAEQRKALSELQVKK